MQLASYAQTVDQTADRRPERDRSGHVVSTAQFAMSATGHYSVCPSFLHRTPAPGYYISSHLVSSLAPSTFRSHSSYFPTSPTLPLSLHPSIYPSSLYPPLIHLHSSSTSAVSVSICSRASSLLLTRRNDHPQSPLSSPSQ